MVRYINLENPMVYLGGYTPDGHAVYHVPSNTPAVDAVEIKKGGEWEMFDLISSAYYGKGMYFKQDNGIVYSRYSCKYMSVDEAIREFISLIDGTEEDNAETH